MKLNYGNKVGNLRSVCFTMNQMWSPEGSSRLGNKESKKLFYLKHGTHLGVGPSCRDIISLFDPSYFVFGRKNKN